MNIIDDCKKYLGISPYDDWTNVCASDFFFYQDLCKKYGEHNVSKTLEELKKGVK